MSSDPRSVSSEIIRVGWLLDGLGGPIQRDRLIHIHGGIIRSIKKVSSADVDRTDIVDMSNDTVMPGLIDSHVHLFMSGTDDLKTRRNQLSAEFKNIKGVIKRHLYQHLARGVVALRDGGDKMSHALCYKMTCHSQKKLPISISVSGKAWHKRGRYGRLIGRSPANKETLADAIAKEKEAGTDHLKIVNSGLNSLIKFGHETAPQFGVEELKAAVKSAAIRGLKVMVHANGKIPVEIAIKSGCHSIEHGFFMGEENLKRMADSHIYWTPTAGTMQAFSGHLERMGQPCDVARRNLEHQLEQIRQAKKLGVNMTAGSDAGSLGVHHGAGIYEELTCLLKAGLTIQEAICCATNNGAKLLNLEDLGSLTVGKPATFIVVKGAASRMFHRRTAIKHIYIRNRLYTPVKKTMI